jgi:predicted ATPase
MILTKLQVQGYRCLADVAIPLRSPMVLIGPNGSGKTALLEIFTLLRDAARERLGNTLLERGGIGGLLFAGGADSVTVRLRARTNAEPELDYSLEIAPSGIGYAIKNETLERAAQLGTEPMVYFENRLGGCRYLGPSGGTDLHLKTLETALAQAPRTLSAAARLRETLEGARLYHALDVSLRAPVRLPQTLQPVEAPGPNGEDLYAALYTLRDSSNDDTYERIQEALRAAFPGFRNLELPLVGSGQATLRWYQSGFEKPFYPNQLSEGTLRFLWLATILLGRRLPPITLIDEPEVSLHPQLLMILAGLFRDAALRTQLIVATHADQLIRWLEPAEVVVVDKEEDRTRLTWADTLDLAEWLKKYTLDELWLMGELGGRS